MADSGVRVTQQPRQYRAPAAGCAADILVALAREPAASTLKMLGERLNQSRSLIRRTLAELERRGLVERDTAGRYGLGLVAAELGGAYLAEIPVQRALRRVLRDLADSTGETASLAVLDGSAAVYLMREEGEHSVFAVSRVGKRLPAHAVAVGKALLAMQKDEDVIERLCECSGRGHQLKRVTNQTVVDVETVLSDLQRVRALGHAEERGEMVLGRCCIAMAVPMKDGFRDVAIGVSMSEARLDAEASALLSALREAAATAQRQFRARLASGEVIADPWHPPT